MKLLQRRSRPQIAALVTVIALGLTWSSLALTQDDEMTIESKALGKHTRPVVVFPHARHAETNDCKICHHDYDEMGTNTGSEGMACADCHEVEQSGNKPPLMKAFHLGCKGCHTRQSARLDKPLPTKCGNCHVRRRR